MILVAGAPFGTPMMAGLESTRVSRLVLLAAALVLASAPAIAGPLNRQLHFESLDASCFAEESRLPPDSTVLYRQLSHLREHRMPTLVASSVAVLQAILIAGLLFEHQRRRRAEVTSRQHLATMAHLDRRVAMGELTASLAHEISQPLNAILQNAGAAEMMLSGMGADKHLDEVRAILADIRKDDVRAGDTILRMRRLLGKRELQTQPLDLNDLARDTIALISPDAAARHVRVETDLSPALDPVAGDRIHLQQVLLNLMLNGMEAMSATPPERRALLIRTSQVNRVVGVSVRDSGAGLTTPTSMQLFEPFCTTKASGMGMGLSIARTIIEAHAGRIEAGNNKDGGATFTFYLRASKAI
jgi:C4-dicarboxylate-specific signal transduction histidine kinase